MLCGRPAALADGQETRSAAAPMASRGIAMRVEGDCWRRIAPTQGQPTIRIAPQIATRIAAKNSQTLLLRTNAAHASAASAARARRSISLKYSTKKFIKTSPVLAQAHQQG